jgi:VRR-NUC domain.
MLFFCLLFTNGKKDENMNNVENIVSHAQVSEKSIERYLAQRCTSLGLVCLKYSNCNLVGFPDRLILLPAGAVVWVELKSRGQKPRAIQQIRHKLLDSIGHQVHVIDSRAGVDNLLFQISKNLKNSTDDI